MKIASPVGILGEELAAKYLQKHGYKIIETNFSKRYGEIDIVAVLGKTLVFVEVKTRTTSQYGTPLEAITPWKLNSLIKTAQFYAMSHPKLPQLLRIDAVAIKLDVNKNIEDIEHIQNISGF